MKNILIISLVLFTTIAAKAQTDTSKVEQYCQLIATQKILSNKVSIDINFGDEKSNPEYTIEYIASQCGFKSARQLQRILKK